MCENEATTEEHIPPKCFFPEEERKKNSNFIIVPSCKEHNNNNSKDVEYVRNIICMIKDSITPYEIREKTKRSLRRGPGLLTTIKEKSARYIFEEENKSTLKTELNKRRFYNIMTSMAYGFFNYEFKKNYYGDWSLIISDGDDGDWKIKKPIDVKEIQMLKNTINDIAKHDFIAFKLNELKFELFLNKIPEVFQCSHLILQDKIIYKCIFYQGFKVYVYSNSNIT